MAIKIEKNIVDYSIKKEIKDEPVLPTKEIMHEEIARPDELLPSDVNRLNLQRVRQGHRHQSTETQGQQAGCRLRSVPPAQH